MTTDGEYGITALMKLTYKIELDVPGLKKTDQEFVTEELRLAIEESLPDMVESDSDKEYAVDVLHVEDAT